VVSIHGLRWDPDVIAKLGSKHGVSVNDVEDVCSDNGAGARWDNDPARGRRLLVDGRTESGRRLRVVLRPTEVPGWFDVVTAF
jgi:uncharacterized DUF497 family protein